MKNLNILITLIIGIHVIFWGCSEEPHLLELSIYGNDIPGTVRDTVLFSTRDTTYLVETKINTGNSIRLMTGRINGFESRTILRFTNFTNIADSAIIDSAKIQLIPDGNLVHNGNFSFPIYLYPAINSWTDNTDSAWNDFEQNIDRSMLLAEVMLNAEDTTTVIIPLNENGIELVSFWADSLTPVEDNAGVILDFSQANFLQYFSSINSEQDPTLIIQYHLPDDTSSFTDTLLANYDASVYRQVDPLTSDRNFVSTLVVYNTLLNFDLRSFLENQPREITLLSANLQLPIDLEKSTGDDRFDISSLVTLRLLSDFEDPQVEVDSTAGLWSVLNSWSQDSTYIEIREGNDRDRLASSLIRRILTDPETPEALAVGFIDVLNPTASVSHEKDFYSNLAFFKGSRQNNTINAKLILTYWIAPAPRL